MSVMTAVGAGAGGLGVEAPLEPDYGRTICFLPWKCDLLHDICYLKAEDLERDDRGPP